MRGGEEKTRAMVTNSGHGYCFSDAQAATTAINPNIQAHVVSQFHQSFDDDSNPDEIYGLSTGMEMIGGLINNPNKNLHHQTSHEDTNNSSVMWKEFFGKSSNHHGGPSSSNSKAISIMPSAAAAAAAAGGSDDQFYHGDFSLGCQESNTTTTTTWHDNRVILEEDPSLRCVFPCQGNERPSQGLSLSLGSSSNNPNSTIGLQSFELRQPDHEDIIRVFPTSSRDGFFGKSVNIQQQQQMMMQAAEGVLGKAAADIDQHHHHHQHQVQFQIRSSKYLSPAQELLNELCNLGTKQNDSTSKLKFQKTNQWQDQENASSTKMQQSSNLYSLDLLELQKRKSKLLQMLEEVDRRYKHYCNQMRAVVASFEAVAGNGAASVYSALASKAMSKHFRCLRDGIVGQIKATKKALGEKDTAAPGTTRGETPRLRLIDQTLRQQKAFQQMSMMESHPWRPQRGLPERAVSVLRAWLFEHFLHPYPSDVDKHILARQTGLSRSQVSNWFINARVRLWKPMVEEMYLEETKEHENMGSSDGDKSMDDTSTVGGRRQNQNLGRSTHQPDQDEEKPTADQLVRIDSECLSSIINNNNNNQNPHEKNVQQSNNNLQLHHLHSFGRVTDSFGAMELDFSSYNHHQQHQQNIRGSGGGGSVSLTLGLQQHGSSGVSLAFSSPTSQNSLFFAREHDIDNEDCPPAAVQYSLLDSEAQNLPYRNLMGAQLLHDLAG